MRAPMDARYDIYIVSEVEALKAAYKELWRRYEAVVGENAELSRQLDRRRRNAVYEEKDLGWMGD